jgi:hypothetical protein
MRLGLGRRVIVVSGVRRLIMCGLDVVDVDGMRVMTVIVVSGGNSRMVIMAVVDDGLVVSDRDRGVFVMSMVVVGRNRRRSVVTVRGSRVAVVIVIVVRLVLVAHDSVPQPLCAVFSGEIGIT